MNANYKYIDEWFNIVKNNIFYTSREEKQLCRLIKEILKDKNVIIDKQIVDDYIRITETYFFKLMPDQKFYATLILGFRYKDNGQLVFNQIFIMKGRGWGKNGFIASLAFFMSLKNHGIQKYNINIVATSEEQAKTSFEDIYDVISDMGEKGKKVFNYNLTKIQNRNTKAKIEYKTSNASTKDGGRPGCVVFDEVHAYKDYQNIKVFTGGLGKISQARRIYITTDGEIRDGVLDDFKERARRILTGEQQHKGFLPIISKLDSLQEVGKKEMWEKANLRIRFCEDLKTEIETEYDEMLQNESLKEAFITKRMNIPFVSKTKTVCSWDDLIFACKNHTWEDLTGVECIGSIDFSDLRDFASAGLRWKYQGKTYFKQHTWIHEKSLHLTEYNIDIKECVDKGWATIVRASEHASISAELIAEWFIEQANQGYYISKIKGDLFRFSVLKEKFLEMGLPELIYVRNGSISHNKTAPVIDLMFTNKTIVFEDDKLLRWYFWNVKREIDKKGNITYLKIEPQRRKTDGFFCFLHSLIDDDLEEKTNTMPMLDIITF